MQWAVLRKKPQPFVKKPKTQGYGQNMSIWQGNVQSLKEQQLSLRERVSLVSFTKQPRFIGGTDVSFNRGSDTAYAGVIVLEWDTLETVEESGVVGELSMPYVPGYLSFREVPLLMEAWQKLKCRPDVVMVDGHGILHPRSLGVATHFGLEAGVPSMGCAKKVLVGSFEPPSQLHQATPMFINSELRGYAYQSRKNAGPVYLSPGTGMLPEDALRIAKHCLRGYRLPEPTRRAHLFVNRLRQGLP